MIISFSECIEPTFTTAESSSYAQPAAAAEFEINGLRTKNIDFLNKTTYGNIQPMVVYVPVFNV